MAHTELRINAENLRKTFHRAGGEVVNALDEVDLKVNAGEFVVLLGPSGCGKTTLLRSIAGLETPESGEIYIDDRKVYSSKERKNVPPEQRNINMMFQSYALWPHMTVAQNVAFPLTSKKISKTEINKRVKNILTRVGIPELAESHPADLSGGQQQRVALARALSVDPSCVLFDEPLSNVDAKVREQLRIELLSMHQKMNFSALYVTHDQTEALQLADRLVVMRNGRIEQQGTPEEIYLHPTNRYVASFIGVSNEIFGKIKSKDSDEVLIDTKLGLLKAINKNYSFVEGQEVSVILRPEILTVHPESEDTSHSLISAKISNGMFAGAHMEYVVETPDGTQIQVWDRHRVRRFSPGDTVAISYSSEDAHLVPNREENRK